MYFPICSSRRVFFEFCCCDVCSPILLFSCCTFLHLYLFDLQFRFCIFRHVFSVLYFRIIFYDVYFPICIFRVAASNSVRSDLYFPTCIPDLYIPICMSRCVFSRLVFSELYFLECILRIVFSDVYLPIFIYPIICIFRCVASDWYSSMCIFPMCIFRFVLYNLISRFELSVLCCPIRRFLIVFPRSVFSELYYLICISQVVFSGLDFPGLYVPIYVSDLYCPICIFDLYCPI